jgi:hypothetical protein
MQGISRGALSALASAAETGTQARPSMEQTQVIRELRGLSPESYPRTECKARRSRLFSSGVPTVIRMQRESIG